MIKPVNGHLLIEPIKHEEFVLTQQGTYEEIGIVLDLDESINPTTYTSGAGGGQFVPLIKKGDRVYFDAWLAAKYPKEGGGQDDFYWLVKWEDVRAIEKHE